MKKKTHDTLEAIAFLAFLCGGMVNNAIGLLSTPEDYPRATYGAVMMVFAVVAFARKR